MNGVEEKRDKKKKKAGDEDEEEEKGDAKEKEYTMSVNLEVCLSVSRWSTLLISKMALT